MIGPVPLSTPNAVSIRRGLEARGVPIGWVDGASGFGTTIVRANLKKHDGLPLDFMVDLGEEFDPFVGQGKLQMVATDLLLAKWSEVAAVANVWRAMDGLKPWSHEPRPQRKGKFRKWEAKRPSPKTRARLRTV